MSTAILGLIVGPIIIFLIFVAPIWLLLHYRSKRQIGQGLTEEDYQRIDSLAKQAEQMAERIGTLEALLDADSPEWRSR